MKCPYRIKRIFSKHVREAGNSELKAVWASPLEADTVHEEFEECIGDECPLFNSTYERCFRAYAERV